MNSKYSHTLLHFQQLLLDLRRNFPFLRSRKNILNTPCSFASETKRLNLGLCHQFSNKTRNLPPYHLTTLSPFPPCQLTTLPPSPTCHLTTLRPLQPCHLNYSPTLSPDYPHATFPPSKLTTLLPFLAHHSPNDK